PAGGRRGRGFGRFDPEGAGMILARVTGKVTGSVQHPAYDGRPIYVLRAIARGRRPAFVAIDTVGCGLGDEVMVARVPGLARTLLRTERAPVRSIIVGILDRHPD